MTAHFPLCLYFVSSRLCVMLESRVELSVSSWQTSTLMCESELPSSDTLNRFSTTVVELKTLNYKVSFQHSLDGQTTHLRAVKMIQSRKDTDMYLSNGNSGLYLNPGVMCLLVGQGRWLFGMRLNHCCPERCGSKTRIDHSPCKNKIYCLSNNLKYLDGFNQ